MEVPGNDVAQILKRLESLKVFFGTIEGEASLQIKKILHSRKTGKTISKN